MAKAVIVGRHKLLKSQEEEIRGLGVNEFIEVLSLPEDPEALNKITESWVGNGVRYVIVQSLPLRVLYNLWRACRDKGVDVLVARMESIALTGSEDEAKRIVEECPERRVYLSSIHDKAYRVIEFRGWEKIEELHIVLKPLHILLLLSLFLLINNRILDLI